MWLQTLTVKNFLVLFKIINCKRLKLVQYIIKMGQSFPKLYSSYRVIKVEVNFSNYATQPDIKKQQVLIIVNCKRKVDVSILN